MKRFVLTHLAPTALLLALVVVPLATGARTLFLRDTLLTHFAMREGLAAAVKQGELPMIDPLRAGGQALLGNLNAVALYPDNLLLLVAPGLWQLNAHFWLHWIVAFAAAFWLARALGWGNPAAAMTGAAYAFSGFFLSQLNLYNAVAAAALAPALAAAALELVGGKRPRRGFVALALIWTLSLLGGDPILAGLALLHAALLAFANRTRDATPTRRNEWLALAAIAIGTLMAAPQLLATGQILGESSRGFRGFEARDLALASPEPPAVLELLLPLFFGRPDSGVHWGNAYFGETPPIYFSLAPGAIALALAAVALGRGGRERRAPALLALGGLVLTFSSGTVLTSLLAAVPGMSLVRFQAKLALLFAFGTALLAGFGAERLNVDERARVLWRRALLAGAVLFALIVLFFALRPGALFAAFLATFAEGLSGPALEGEVKRWAGCALITAVALVVVRIAATRRSESLGLAIPVAIAAQVGLQLLLLRGIVPADAAASYRRSPPVFAGLPQSARLVHGAVNDLFGPHLMAAPGADPRLAAQVRRAWESGFDFAAHAEGRRTELDTSPEGLDPFTLLAAEDAIQSLADSDRVKLLRATGVDFLLLPRPLAGVPDGAARPAREISDSTPPLSIYEIAGGWGEVAVASCVTRAPHMNAALARLLADDFDPGAEAVVPGTGTRRCEPGSAPGAARIVRESREEVEIEVDAMPGGAGGALVLARAYLPIWRAEIDGRPAKPVPAQMTRLAVELPAGARRVRFHVDRSPLRLGFGLALAGALGLALLAWRAFRPRSAPER